VRVLQAAVDGEQRGRGLRLVHSRIDGVNELARRRQGLLRSIQHAVRARGALDDLSKEQRVAAQALHGHDQEVFYVKETHVRQHACILAVVREGCARLEESRHLFARPQLVCTIDDVHFQVVQVCQQDGDGLATAGSSRAARRLAADTVPPVAPVL